MADIEDIRMSLLQLQEHLQHDPGVGDEDTGGGEDVECSVFDYVSDSDTVDVDADLCLDLSFESGEINDGKQVCEATIETQDEDASLGEIASKQVCGATIQTQTQAPSHDASTQATSCCQDSSTHTEPGCLHGLRQLIRCVFAPLGRTRTSCKPRHCLL